LTGPAALIAGAGLALAGGAWWRRQGMVWGGPQRLPAIDYPIIDGRRIGPAELAGRPVLINFWATTCGICIAEMPDLIRLYEAWRPRGLQMLAIAMPYDRPDRVIEFARRKALPFPVALDPMGQAVAAWGGVEATPLSWLAGRDGRIRQRWLGRPDFTRLRADIEALLPSA
jgi:peroxiredoxin